MQREEVIPAGTSRIRHCYIANFARGHRENILGYRDTLVEATRAIGESIRTRSRRNQIEMLEIKIRAVGLYLKSRTAIEFAMHGNQVKGNNPVREQRLISNQLTSQ